jgi:Glycine-rich domain-containing protein-like
MECPELAPVTPRTVEVIDIKFLLIECHLAILRFFILLFRKIESSDLGFDSNAEAVSTFLLCAESRYVRYLHLLRNFASKMGPSGAQGWTEVRMPLPPWYLHTLIWRLTARDVAIIFHAHCLAGQHYANDILSVGGFRSVGLPSFPLERLHDLVLKGIWSDPESERIWTETVCCPYQLWKQPPSEIGKCILQNVVARCSFCDVLVELECRLLSGKPQTETAGYECTSCRKSFLPTGMTYTLPSPVGLDVRYLLQTPALLMYRPTRLTSTSIYEGVDSACPVRQNAPPLPYQAGQETPMLRWRELSVDLVNASLRQKVFSEKITGEQIVNWRLTNPDSIVRYNQFMALIKQGVSQVVPTLDIDLYWHTHQLSPRLYRLWCIENVGREVIHNDDVVSGDLELQFRETSLAWVNLFHTAYTKYDPRKQYLSPLRIAAGIVCLPYGLHVFLKSRKLGQAQIGMWACDTRALN